jgi:hypothetical protein
MNLQKYSIFKFFHYFWIILSIFLIIYVISKNIVIERDLIYKLDFSKSINRNITGWYPDSRIVFINDKIRVLNEPLYLKVYIPVKFKNLIIKGELEFKDENIKIGLKQKDNTYFWKDIIEKNINLNFNLDNVLIVGNKLELLLSIPDIQEKSNINLKDWEIELIR